LHCGCWTGREAARGAGCRKARGFGHAAAGKHSRASDVARQTDQQATRERTHLICRAQREMLKQRTMLGRQNDSQTPIRLSGAVPPTIKSCSAASQRQLGWLHQKQTMLRIACAPRRAARCGTYAPSAL
jgi:hypothetical protein